MTLPGRQANGPPAPSSGSPAGAPPGGSSTGAPEGGAPPGGGSSPSAHSVEADALARLQPSAQERRAMQETVEDLLVQAQAALDAMGQPGTASIQGSIAKGTWLAGSTDVDVFLLLDPKAPEEALPQAARRVGQAVLSGAIERYAQHPYVVGRFRGLDVDIVPAYAVEHASRRMSAVDRTPFHTAWAAAALDGAARAQVRLAKAWCMGVGAYGADTARAGFSGYLVEVLIAALGDFASFVDWLAAGAQPRRFSVGQDAVTEEAPLVVVDPVDPARNCAAAVAAATLQLAVEAAKAYRRHPSLAFFFPAPARAEPPEVLDDALDERAQTWLGLWFPEAAERLDIVFPQFQKAGARIRDALIEAGFQVPDWQAWTDERSVGLQWLLDSAPLPPARVHTGPPEGTPHAERFRAKWNEHPEAVSPVTVHDGHLQVEVRVPDRRPHAWLEHNLANLPLGKHVQAALGQATLHAHPGDVVSAWSPTIADFILGRRPWQR